MEPDETPHDALRADVFAGAMRPTEALEDGFIAPPDDADESADVAAAVERLAIRVGNLNLLCTPDAGREVILPPAASSLPHTPPWLVGIANVRGALVPVVDLASAFKVERDSRLRSYLLITGEGPDQLGLLVDGLPVLQRFDTAAKMSGLPPHPQMLAGHLNGAYEHGGTVWMDVNIPGLLDTMDTLVARPPG